MDWREKRSRIRGDMADVFSERTGIAREDFLEIFYDAGTPPPIGDFSAQYIADEEVLGQIFSALASSTVLPEERVADHYHPEESFQQFAEHLLRAGAYNGGAEE
jgi:hypothetical protein